MYRVKGNVRGVEAMHRLKIDKIGVQVTTARRIARVSQQYCLPASVNNTACPRQSTTLPARVSQQRDLATCPPAHRPPYTAHPTPAFQTRHTTPLTSVESASRSQKGRSCIVNVRAMTMNLCGLTLSASTSPKCNELNLQMMRQIYESAQSVSI